MKILFLICVLFGFFSTGLSAAIELPDLTHPAHPGKCYLSPNVILEYDEERFIHDGCTHLHCRENSSVTMIRLMNRKCIDKINERFRL